MKVRDPHGIYSNRKVSVPLSRNRKSVLAFQQVFSFPVDN